MSTAILMPSWYQVMSSLNSCQTTLESKISNNIIPDECRFARLFTVLYSFLIQWRCCKKISPHLLLPRSDINVTWDQCLPPAVIMFLLDTENIEILMCFPKIPPKVLILLSSPNMQRNVEKTMCSSSKKLIVWNTVNDKCHIFPQHAASELYSCLEWENCVVHGFVMLHAVTDTTSRECGTPECASTMPYI